MSGGADACRGASRPRPSLVLPLKTALGVAGSPGGRSWKRRQELVSLHSSALQRKLSSTASLDGLSCHSAGRATRAAASKMRPAAAADRGHLPNGVPSLRPPGSTPAGSASGADSEEAAGAPPARSPKQRRISRQQQEVETGNKNAALPKPDLSGVACVGAAASAASQEKQEKGSVQQQQGSKSSRQELSAAGTSDSDSAGTGLFAPSGKSCVKLVRHNSICCYTSTCCSKQSCSRQLQAVVQEEMFSCFLFVSDPASMRRRDADSQEQ